MPLPTIPSGNVASALGGTYEVANSCRFNQGDSPRLSKSVSAGTSNTKFTVSMWFKTSGVNTNYGRFFWGGADSGKETNITLYHVDHASEGAIALYFDGSSSARSWLTNAGYLDPSAWYHMVVRVDTTDSTAGDRIQLWINGKRVTSWSESANPDENETYDVFHSNNITIGREQDSNDRFSFDGLLAEVCVIDGTAYTASDFGEFDEDSPTIWKAKDVSGLTFGTNGFYLDFESSGTLGNDANGGTDLTANNLDATDQSADTPTLNYATFNPLVTCQTPSNNSTYTQCNLQSQTTNTGGQGGVSTMGVNKGKYYAEFKLSAESSSTEALVGVVKNPHEGFGAESLHDSNKFYGARSNAQKYTASTAASSWCATWGAGDIMSVALDADNNRCYIAKNGQWSDGSGNFDESTPNAYVTLSSDAEDIWFFAVGDAGGGANVTHQANFGNPAFSISSGNQDANGYGNFEYAVPSGYFAMNSFNINEDDPVGVDDSEANFQAKTYTGNGTAIGSGGLSVTLDGSTNMQPDLIWIKRRDALSDHEVYDSLRGVGDRFYPNTTTAEDSNVAEALTAFNSDGFTYGNSGGGNASGGSYIAWCWKAGTTGSGTTGGSGTAKAYSYSVNTTTGISIVKYVGNGTEYHRIPHHQGTAPLINIVKRYDGTAAWPVYSRRLTSSNYNLLLNEADAQADSAGAIFYSWADSTYFGIGTNVTVNTNDANYMSYNFVPKHGFSAMGVIEGNGATDNVFCYTHFKPAFVMIKNIDTGSRQWNFMDNKREGFNPDNDELTPNNNAAEGNSDFINLFSNGFKVRTSSGYVGEDTLLYLAFAEAPFINSSGVPCNAR